MARNAMVRSVILSGDDAGATTVVRGVRTTPSSLRCGSVSVLFFLLSMACAADRTLLRVPRRNGATTPLFVPPGSTRCPAPSARRVAAADGDDAPAAPAAHGRTRRTCVGIVPPYFFSSARGETKSAWDAIQRLRYFCGDPDMYRVPPHVPLLFPFGPRTRLPAAAARVAAAVEEAGLRPFRATFDGIRAVRADDATYALVLEPDRGSAATIAGVQEALAAEVCGMDGDGGCRPELVLGRFTSHGQALKVLEVLRGGAAWDPISFEVTELHLMARDAGAPSPFVCDARVQLGDLPDGIPSDELVDLTELARSLEEDDAEVQEPIVLVGELKISDEDVTDFEAFDDYEDDVLEGTVMRIGRTTFFTGEMGEYDGMPAMHSTDGAGAAPIVGGSGGLERRKNRRFSRVNGDYGGS